VTIPKRFLRAQALVYALAVLASVVTIPLALASVDPENPKPWPERILHLLGTTADHAFLDLSSALFNSLNGLNADLLGFAGNGHVGIELHRDVLDNFDHLNTYTVIDRVRFKAKGNPLGNVTTWKQDVQTFGLGTPYVALIFQPQASIEWSDVRQVKALDFKNKKEPTAKMLKKQAEARTVLSPNDGDKDDVIKTITPLPEASPDPNLSELNPDVPIAFLDPSIRARFARVPNLLTFPFRLPLNRADVRKMSDGEVLSYAFDGQFDVGVSVGLKVIPTLNVVNAGINIQGTHVVHGRHQISVLRESDRYARVKLTRVVENGFQEGVHVGIDRQNAFTGFNVGVQKDFLKFDANFVPFDWSALQLKTNQFDVVYRYDLDDPVGKAAFHKAVLGHFSESDWVTGGRTGDTSLPVERMLSRDSEIATSNHHSRIEISQILHLDWDAQHESLKATIELPDGTHHLLEAYRQKQKKHRVFFGASGESKTRRMTLLVDAELLAAQDPQSIFVVAEVTEDDSNTSGDELNQAIARMENLLRKPDLLPDIAMTMPGKKDNTSQSAWYGRSSFYYGYSLGYKEVTRFLSMDPNQLEAAAARAFLDDARQADRFVRAWGNASAAFVAGADAKVLFDDLNAVFSGKFSLEAVTNIVFDSLAAQSIDYFVTAQNIAFGRVQDRGKTVPAIQTALTNTDRSLGFETYSQRTHQDTDAVVRDIHIDTMPSGLKMLRFVLAYQPANISFELFRVSDLNRQSLITEDVVNNWNGRFKAGQNSILLDPNSVDLLTSKLSRDLRQGAGVFYNLSVSYSRTAEHYGPTATVKYMSVGDPYPVKD
jgi:hypothetical protein